MNSLQRRMYAELQRVARDRGWELISINYIDNKTNLSFKCPNEHIRKIRPDHFKRGTGCAVCSGKDPVNAKLSFENRIRELGGTLIGEYVNIYTPVFIICKEGHRSNIFPTNVHQGQGICSACAGNNSQTSKEKFTNRVMELGGTIVGEYIKSYENVEVICSNGHVCNVPPARVNNGKNVCFICSSGLYDAKIEFAARVNQLGGKIISPYINNHTHVTVICKNNHECLVNPSNIRLGCSICNICNGSGGEQLVAASLDFLGLKYIAQYSLPGKLFRYDFATGINMINTVIEWDGEQHFKFVKFFHETTEKFLYNQNCDREKTRNIINLGCKMIRIDYTWGNKRVEEIAQFIYVGLHSNDQLILSNSDMYKWLVNC